MIKLSRVLRQSMSCHCRQVRFDRGAPGQVAVGFIDKAARRASCSGVDDLSAQGQPQQPGRQYFDRFVEKCARSAPHRRYAQTLVNSIILTSIRKKLFRTAKKNKIENNTKQNILFCYWIVRRANHRGGFKPS